MIVSLGRDLAFSSKISGVATALGRKAKNARSADQFRESLSLGPTLVIVDLNFPECTPEQVMQMLTASGFAGRVVGYCSHVDTNTIESARAAGFAEVMPRSKFVQQLQSLLAE